MNREQRGTPVQRYRGKRSVLARSLTLAVGASTILSGVLLAPVAASAAEELLTVTSLGLGGNAASGVCEATAGAGDCTLRGALEIANASTNPDGVRIAFDAALSGAGEISLTGGAANSMHTSDMTGTGSENATVGARFLVDSAVPVAVDFTNLDGITDVDGSHTAGIYVASDGVSLSNLKNLRAAESGIAVGGTGTTIANVGLEDSTSSTQEVGVLLLDGATETELTGLSIYSAYWGSVVVDNNATVADTTIVGLASRGVENWGHIIFEDNAVISGFSISDSVLGNPVETSPSHGFFVNPGVVVDGLVVADSTVQSPTQNGFFFLGGGQSLTGTSITGTTFGGNADAPISRVIGDNTADWSGLDFSGNTISYAGGVVFRGTVADASFDANDFSHVIEPAYAALQIGSKATDVTVTANTFDGIYALDTIRVQGTSATDVVIDGNTIDNLTAAVSRSAIRIDASGSGNVVQNNTLTQDLADPDLPANIDNHWAIYNSANAADAASSNGWSILGNAIDGFGGRDRSAAPIENSAIGKLLVAGNTFGVNTRGSADAETEEGPYWFFWNVHNTLSNNTVQTLRAESVRYDGANATFTATRPANEAGNNSATDPVTLHVYWTAADNAEEYLGALTGVTAGSTVSIPTTHKGGFLRVQTVDADGFTSQYSSIDEDIAVGPPAPAVASVTGTTATGTGQAGAGITVRDAAGRVVATAVVGEDGTWTLEAELVCDTDYTVSQTVDGIESDATEFSTAACAVTPGNGGTKNPVGGGLAATGGENLTGVAIGALLALLAGAGSILFARRRRA